MASVVVPGLDLAPSVPSRVVTVDVIDMTEGTPAAGAVVDFILPQDLHARADGKILKAGTTRLTLDSNGHGEIRVPAYSAATTPEDWVLLVKKSWAPYPYPIRVPAGTGKISLASLNPPLEVSDTMARYAITDATASAKTTTAGGVAATVKSVSGGIADFEFTFPEMATLDNVVPTTRGTVPDGDDLDDYLLPDQAGTWYLRGSYVYGHLPVSLNGGSLLEVSASRTDGIGATQRLATNAGAEYYRSRRDNGSGWAPWEQVADTTSVPRSASAQAILELAKTDGWAAVYNPGDSKTRRMRLGRIYSIADGLGTYPDAVSTATSGTPIDPEYVESGGLGALPSIRFGQSGAAALRTAAFDTDLEQPTFILTVARAATDEPRTGRFVVDGATVPAKRNAIMVSSVEANTRGGFGAYAGVEIYLRDIDPDTSPHTLGVQYAGTRTRLFYDGTPQYITPSGRLGSFTSPLNGLTIGGRYNNNTAETVWDGWIGPVLIFKGIPSDEQRNRMEKLLRAYLVGNTESVQVASEAAIGFVGNTITYKKNIDEPLIPASLTKMLTGVIARKTITNALLDEPVTVTSTDNPGGQGSLPRLQVGDVITYRDLLYLMMLPSHNAAARIMGRAVGSKLAGVGSSIDKFVAAMNAHADAAGWSSAVFNDTSGLDSTNRLSARDAASLLQATLEDATLTEIMGAMTHQISLGGPNARVIEAIHTIDKDGAVSFPNFLSGKTGTLGGVGNIAIATRSGGVTKRVVTLRVTPKNQRLVDAKAILDDRKYAPLAPVAGQVDVFGGQALGVPGSEMRNVLDGLYAPKVDGGVQTFALDSLVPGLIDAGEGVLLTVGAGVVQLTVAAATLPENLDVSGLIPSAYRPATHSYGALFVDASGEVCRMQVAPNGRFRVTGNSGSGVLRGSMVWVAAQS